MDWWMHVWPDGWIDGWIDRSVFSVAWMHAWIDSWTRRRKAEGIPRSTHPMIVPHARKVSHLQRAMEETSLCEYLQNRIGAIDGEDEGGRRKKGRMKRSSTLLQVSGCPANEFENPPSWPRGMAGQAVSAATFPRVRLIQIPYSFASPFFSCLLSSPQGQ